MGSGELGLTEAVSVALGGMIGGGIYAVLGVVTQIAGPATWVAFVLAGAVAMAAGYSYVQLNHLVRSADGADDEKGDQAGDEDGDGHATEKGDGAGDEDGDDDGQRSTGGGAVTFVQAFTGNTTLAGMVGWTLLVGYVGSMAMYAFAFGEFTVTLPLVPESVAGLPLRPLLSVLAVAGFVGLNLLGARTTGSTENVLVAAKVLVLVAFGLGGLAYALSVSGERVPLGASEVASVGPIMAAAVAFVAFQGWNLIFYDQERLDAPGSQIPRAVYLAIPLSAFIYVIVAVATFALAPEALESHPHTALANAASTMSGAVGLAAAGGVVISLSALFSTGSAINATLFSAGYFAKGMLADDLLPDRIGDASAQGVPTRTILVLGAITAALTAYGSLEAITAFASLSFIVVFGGMSYLAFTQRGAERVHAVPPAIGSVGGGLFFVLLFYHLYAAQRGTFFAVLAIATVVLAVELLYFERDLVAEEITEIERGLPTDA